MASAQVIRLASFAAVVFLYLQVIVCKNAAISRCADSQLVDSSLTLNCEYIGNGSEVAIYWYNGSNSDILALKPGSNIPQCDEFARIDNSFDAHRINYTCNPASNVYTLTINPLQKLDNNVTWSCTFLDPAPDPVKAECIIRLSESTDATPEDGRISTSTVIAIIVLVFCTFLLIAVIIILYRRRRRRRICKTCYQRNREHNVEAHAQPLTPDRREQETYVSTSYVSTWAKDPDPMIYLVKRSMPVCLEEEK